MDASVTAVGEGDVEMEGEGEDEARISVCEWVLGTPNGGLVVLAIGDEEGEVARNG